MKKVLIILALILGLTSYAPQQSEAAHQYVCTDGRGEFYIDDNRIYRQDDGRVIVAYVICQYPEDYRELKVAFGRVEGDYWYQMLTQSNSKPKHVDNRRWNGQTALWLANHGYL